MGFTCNAFVLYSFFQVNGTSKFPKKGILWNSTIEKSKILVKRAQVDCKNLWINKNVNCAHRWVALFKVRTLGLKVILKWMQFFHFCAKDKII